MATTVVNDEATREIVVSRIINAPCELVFDAWTDEKHISNWWGPVGFTTTTKTMDVRPGGVWEFTMHGPDGRDYPNTIWYRKVERPELLEYSHGGEEGVHFEAIITFEERGEKQTHVTLKSVFPTAEAREHVVREYGAIEGAEQTLQRLAELLESGKGTGTERS